MSRIAVWILAVVVVGVIVMAVALGIGFALISGTPIQIEDGTVVEIRLRGPLDELPQENVLAQLLGVDSLSLWEMGKVLQYAARDERVAGVYLEIHPLLLSWAQIEELRDAPDSDAGADSAAAEAIDALTARIADLQDASENAQEQFQAELAARDRELQQLRMDLDLARLEANKPTPAPLGPTDEELRAREEERLRREEEARRLAELQRRAEEERAFQERRISSPVIAFGGTGGANAGETELTERTFGEVTDFVLNGALPSAITQAEVIANPSNTVIQGTMIQAVMETALDSSLPGQTRAIISEDVFSYDGSRLLIPRGSRLIGRFRSGIEIAQRRVTIAWDRIILPNNQTVQISSFGGDELGRSGVTGFVDTRFDERFGSAALISIISAAPSVAAAQVEDETTADVLEDVGDDLANATDSVIGEYLSIGPVIYVDQGARVTVMVDRDLEIF